MINANLNAKNYGIQNNEAVSHGTLNETAKISFKGLPPERDCFVKNNENRNDGCPASIDKTRDDTEHIKVRKKNALCL